MGYIDAKGRPELVVNPAIKLGMAFFKPVLPPKSRPWPMRADHGVAPRQIPRAVRGCARGPRGAVP
ncbi:hypothetical protein GS531_25085 [Rhodococcus hoagii]|nr:hypothetical protein [Prescottella equi]